MLLVAVVAVTDADDSTTRRLLWPMIMTMQAHNQPQLLLAQHPNYYSPSQRDAADDDTLLVAVVGADADDTLAAQQPSYYSHFGKT
jgi:hypothetical protein